MVMVRSWRLWAHSGWNTQKWDCMITKEDKQHESPKTAGQRTSTEESCTRRENSPPCLTWQKNKMRWSMLTAPSSTENMFFPPSLKSLFLLPWLRLSVCTNQCFSCLQEVTGMHRGLQSRFFNYQPSPKHAHTCTQGSFWANPPPDGPRSQEKPKDFRRMLWILNRAEDQN